MLCVLRCIVQILNAWMIWYSQLGACGGPSASGHSDGGCSYGIGRQICCEYFLHILNAQAQAAVQVMHAVAACFE